MFRPVSQDIRTCPSFQFELLQEEYIARPSDAFIISLSTFLREDVHCQPVSMLFAGRVAREAAKAFVGPVFVRGAVLRSRLILQGLLSMRSASVE